MASTLQNIISTIRGINAVPSAKVNYGVSDGLTPPYISVRDYSHEYAYQTGPKPQALFKECKFTVLVVDKSQDNAEALAAQVDDVLNLSPSVTPTCSKCFQESYRVGQLEYSPQLYQYGVEIQLYFARFPCVEPLR